MLLEWEKNTTFFEKTLRTNYFCRLIIEELELQAPSKDLNLQSMYDISYDSEEIEIAGYLEIIFLHNFLKFLFVRAC